MIGTNAFIFCFPFFLSLFLNSFIQRKIEKKLITGIFNFANHLVNYRCRKETAVFINHCLPNTNLNHPYHVKKERKKKRKGLTKLPLRVRDLLQISNSLPIALISRIFCLHTRTIQFFGEGGY